MTNTDPQPGGTGGPAVDPDLEPGQVVGEYVIDGKLGQGGFGAVFKASHPLIGKEVAVKVLARRFSVDPDMVERFQAEARAVNQIRHRHIIDIFSFGTLDDGRAYYVMEYLEGETLGERLARETRLSFEVALPILRAIARALDAAHSKDIAHRDLKPDNVFLARSRDPADGDDFAKLLDFGIAKLMRVEESLKSKTQTGVPMGTPYYMSPEQCRGRDVDHRTDYYAFGVVAYQLLTGVYPIDGDDYMTVLMKQISEDAPPASSHLAELPAGIDDVLAWLMRKDPADRPPSLAAAMQALDAVAAAEGIAVPRAPRSAPVDVPRATHGQGAVVTPAGLARTDAMTPVAAAALATTSGPDHPATRARGRGIVLAAVALGAVVLGAGVFALVRSADAPTRSGALARPPTTPIAVAPPVVPAPGSTAAPAPPRPPERVTLTITDAPDGTEIHGPSGSLLGVVPTLQLARDDHDLVLTFQADGYRPVSRTLHPTADASLSVKLEKKGAATTVRPSPAPPSPPIPPSGTTAGHDTIEDPFAHLK